MAHLQSSLSLELRRRSFSSRSATSISPVALGFSSAAGLFALMDWECKQELWVDFMQFCQLHLLRSCRSLVPRALILAFESDGIVVRPDGAEIVNACGRCLHNML